MQYRLIQLKLYMDNLSIEFDMSTYSGRKRAQQAVYLGQMAGADIGFPFGMYLTGPYSPELMKALIKLEDNLWDEEYKEYELHDYLDGILNKIKDLMNVPEQVELSQAEWLELVASAVYFSNDNKCQDDNELKRVFLKDRGSLPIYINNAIL